MYTLLILVVWLNLLSAAPTDSPVNGKVFLISMDGFRWDYLSLTDTPNFDKLISQGVKVNQVTGTFATWTLPNHWTIVTGLYEEDHGIIANNFYDPLYDEVFKYGSEAKWFNATEPIWIAAERENKKSGAYSWIGNEVVYDGYKPTKKVGHVSQPDYNAAIDDITDWFVNDDLDFACIYINQPDKLGHPNGPADSSDIVLNKVKDLDALMGHLMDNLDNKGLTEKINVMIVGDHGMTLVDDSRSIDLGQWVDFDNDVKWSYLYATGLIFPNEGKLDKIYDALKAAEGDTAHFKVYKKEDLPEDLHYSNNRRISPIVVLADPGWILKWSSNDTIDWKGDHGWDNKVEDMKTMFIGRGPNFKCDYKQDTLRNVDYYPLMCYILGLKNCHGGPGDLNAALPLITTEPNKCLETTSAAGLLASAAGGLSFLLPIVSIVSKLM